MIQDYYNLSHEEFSKHSKINFNFVDTSEELNNVVFRELAETIKLNSKNGLSTKVVFPVGPLNYEVFTSICNKENISCESLVIFAMDEYIENGEPLSPDHPLSFKGFFLRTLYEKLDKKNRFPPENLIIPMPENIDLLPKIIEDHGGIDITFGGFGINGHFAFNSYSDSEDDVESFAATKARIVELREGDIVQNAIAGTFGNLEVIPRKACTLGISELLSANLIHLTFMRTWHSGVLRRALFGPITSKFPGSLVQLHSNVKATITQKALQIPSFNLRLLSSGE